MNKRRKKPNPQIEIAYKRELELYIARTHIEYDKFKTNFAVIGPGGILQIHYKRYDPETARRLYEDLILELREDEKGLDLHCKGKDSKFRLDERIDGYFGRPMYIFRTTFFLRNLTNPERSFVQKQFNALNAESALKIRLVD